MTSATAPVAAALGASSPAPNATVRSVELSAGGTGSGSTVGKVPLCHGQPTDSGWRRNLVHFINLFVLIIIIIQLYSHDLTFIDAVCSLTVHVRV